MCSWGFGELAPVGNSTDSLTYLPTTSQASIIDSLGEQALVAMIKSSYIVGQPAMVGTTNGAARSSQDCIKDSNNTIDCTIGNGTLQYSTAMAAFYLEDGLVSYMNSWRGNTSVDDHKTNINYGET